MEWQEKLKADIKQATIYPITISIALFGFIIVLFTFVVPTFIKLLTDLGVALPFPTRLVMSVSNFFVATWWVWLLTLIFLPATIKFIRKHSGRFAYTIDDFKLNIVLFGELNRMFTVSN
jgi:type II secretory pathway component PulF